MQGDLPKMVRTWRNQSAPSARFRRRRRRVGRVDHQRGQRLVAARERAEVGHHAIQTDQMQ